MREETEDSKANGDPELKMAVTAKLHEEQSLHRNRPGNELHDDRATTRNRQRKTKKSTSDLRAAQNQEKNEQHT
jgi:hypothetical protein